MPYVQRHILLWWAAVVSVLSVAGLLFWITSSQTEALGATLSTPFIVGERLTYTLSWGNLTAGTAVLEVAERQTLNGRRLFKLVHTARSNDFISVFYPVNNRAESLFDEDLLYPHRLLFKRREGKRKNDIDIVFDQVKHQATINKDGHPEIVEVPPHVQDILSCLYFFRTLPDSSVGSSRTLDVYHDNKNYHLELRVEGHERLKGLLGDVETIRILAIMPFRGLFLNEGNVRVWLTNDAARVPVLMKAKVVIGSISATLQSLEGVSPAIRSAPGTQR